MCTPAQLFLGGHLNGIIWSTVALPPLHCTAVPCLFSAWCAFSRFFSWILITCVIQRSLFVRKWSSNKHFKCENGALLPKKVEGIGFASPGLVKFEIQRSCKTYNFNFFFAVITFLLKVQSENFKRICKKYLSKNINLRFWVVIFLPSKKVSNTFVAKI